MPLDDAAIERYSRQIVLAEIGPRGQTRLAAARVAVVGAGAAAERAAAYLAAAGVGTLALSPALERCVDPDQPGIRVEPVARGEGASGARYDVALVAIASDVARPPPDARRFFWIADGRAAEIPPCAACAAHALGTGAAVAPVLAPLRDALLGAIVATEIVKALLEIGAPLRGRVLAYDPETATIVTTPVAARADCPRCRSMARD